MLKKLGAEFEILRQVPVEDIAVSFGEDIAGAIGKIRAGEVKKTAGYDGEYGKITY